ncbi:MAG: protein kinase [Polyangiales bacterium]
MNTRPPSLQLGGLVGGKYRLLKKIGEGGHGRVYRAINTLLGREVAIKVLKPELVGDEIAKKRFFREAKTANLVRHPNVVDVLDVGDSDEGPWMVQELLVGEPLSAVLSREGTLTVKHAIELLLPVLSALSVAHARGIAHRDFKPENVFLVRGEDGAITPKILDFGLSKSSIRFGGPRDSDRITGTGVVVGTPAYLAPERVRMESDGDVRGDVWAIGVVLYECTTGFLPFPARTVREMFIQISNGMATPIEDVFPEVDPSFATIVMRCLRKDPEQRYPSAAEIEDDIRRYLEGLTPDVTQRHAVVRLPPDPIVPPERESSSESDGEAPRAELPSLIETHADIRAAAALKSAKPARQPTPPGSAITQSASEQGAKSKSAPSLSVPSTRTAKPTPTIEEEEPSTTTRVLMVVLAIVALGVVVALWRSSAQSTSSGPTPSSEPAPDVQSNAASDTVEDASSVALDTGAAPAREALSDDSSADAANIAQPAAQTPSTPRNARPANGARSTARDAASATSAVQLRDNR